MTISKLSELVIDNCFYCGGDFTVEGLGDQKWNYLVDVYTCNQCYESFEIHLHSNYVDEVRTSFFFSCGNIYVRCLSDFFAMSRDASLQYKLLGLGAPNAKIPIFPVDFSDKEKLQVKLKTYLLLS